MSLVRSILLYRQTLRLATRPSSATTLSMFPLASGGTQVSMKAPSYATYHHHENKNLNHNQYHHHHRFYSSVSPHHLQSENSSSSTPSPLLSHHPFSSETLLITETGKKRLQQIVSSNDGTYLRIMVEGGGCSGFQYKFNIDNKELEADDDVVLSSEQEEDDKHRVVIDKTSLDILKGSTIDYETELIRSAFRVINIPLAEQGCSCGASFNVKID